MTDHEIGTREEWLAARVQLLVREKEHTRLGDAHGQQRRELPRVRVEKEYRFDTTRVRRRSVSCSTGAPSSCRPLHVRPEPRPDAVRLVDADSVNGELLHLHARGLTFVFVCQAPLQQLQA